MIVDPDLPDHPKTWKLAKKLGISRGEAVVLLLRLWGHCQTRRDDFLGRDADDLAACARWEGKPSILLAGLLAASYVDRTESGYTAHGWKERNHNWLSRIAGGKARQEKAHRHVNGQLATSIPPASKPALNQLAGANAGGVEWSSSREENPHLSRAQAREALVFETRDTLCRIFSRKKYLGQEATVALGGMADAGVLPLSPDDWAALERFYRERKNAAPGDKSWRTNADAIAVNLAGEVEKARTWLAANSIEITSAEKEAAPSSEPTGWPSWFAAEYPETDRPASFHELPASLRSEFGVWLSRNPELVP